MEEISEYQEIENGTNKDHYARDCGKKGIYSISKRTFDFVGSLILTIILLPLFFIIAVIIKLQDGGPVIFRQERLGINKARFTIYKFRSMRLDAEAKGPKWAEENDDRLLKCGAFLRKYHLDELPQLLNILKGDMSFVGPRPERAYFYNEFKKTIHGFDQRLMVKPGLTGLAQVNGGYDITPKIKYLYDKIYISKRSVGLDFLILIKTIYVVCRGIGGR